MLYLSLQKTKAGILLPEKAQGAVNEAVVIAVGPGTKNKVHTICILIIIILLR